MTLQTLVNKFGSYSFLNNKRVTDIEDVITEMTEFHADIEARLLTLENARQRQIKLNATFKPPVFKLPKDKLTSREKKSLWDRIFK